jgi:hypothetical protein
MESARASALFAAAFATVAWVDIRESGSERPAVWLALLLTTAVASAAFWVASRKSTYGWYSAPLAGFATVMILTTLHNWIIQFGRVTALASTLTALVLVPMVFARVLAEQKPREGASSLP